jgi:hypothetical protein
VRDVTRIWACSTVGTQLQTPEGSDPAHRVAHASSRPRLTSNRIEGLEPRARFYWQRRRQLLQLGIWLYS